MSASLFGKMLGRGAAPGWLVVELGDKVSLTHVRHEGARARDSPLCRGRRRHCRKRARRIRSRLAPAPRMTS